MWEAGGNATCQEDLSIVQGSLSVTLCDAGEVSGEDSNVFWEGGGNRCVCTHAFVHGVSALPRIMPVPGSSHIADVSL